MEMVALPSQFSEISLMVRAFAPAEEQHAIHVAEDGFRVLIVDGLALGKLLI